MKIVDTIIVKQRSVYNVIKLITDWSLFQAFRLWGVSRLLKIAALENPPPLSKKENWTNEPKKKIVQETY